MQSENYTLISTVSIDFSLFSFVFFLQGCKRKRKHLQSLWKLTSHVKRQTFPIRMVCCSKTVIVLKRIHSAPFWGLFVHFSPKMRVTFIISSAESSWSLHSLLSWKSVGSTFQCRSPDFLVDCFYVFHCYLQSACLLTKKYFRPIVILVWISNWPRCVWFHTGIIRYC